MLPPYTRRNKAPIRVAHEMIPYYLRRLQRFKQSVFLMQYIMPRARIITPPRLAAVSLTLQCACDCAIVNSPISAKTRNTTDKKRSVW